MLVALLAAAFVALFLLSRTATAAGNMTLDEKVSALSDAIAQAEGFYAGNTIPQRQNNPGDLRDATGAIATYPDPQTGWAALNAQARRILTGAGTAFYNPSMTWYEVGAMYVNGGASSDQSNAWAENVAGALGVDPNATVGDWVTS